MGTHLEKIKTEFQQINWVDNYQKITLSVFTIGFWKYSYQFRTFFFQSKNEHWQTKGLLKSINTKSAVYRRFLISPTPAGERHRKSFRNKFNHLLKFRKRVY